MSYLNQAQLIGNLGADPEIRYTQAGTAVANFSLATNERWKDRDGNQQEKTEWHRVVAWAQLAEIVGEYLKKGSKVFIQGRLQTRSYDDRNGITRYTTEIVASDMRMLGDRNGGSSQQNGNGGGGRQQQQDEPNVDEGASGVVEMDW